MLKARYNILSQSIFDGNHDKKFVSRFHGEHACSLAYSHHLTYVFGFTTRQKTNTLPFWKKNDKLTLEKRKKKITLECVISFHGKKTYLGTKTLGCKNYQVFPSIFSFIVFQAFYHSNFEGYNAQKNHGLSSKAIFQLSFWLILLL